ncbi:hypothetical protein M7I_3085 [Glarea lozoyensis 74030]|uniref:Uncharacterized protein n=1 Tax=Glarea lozoyensis (strain ATCC 74030 / MF5533) TaxID=1104152 RepID=H0EKI7_GLAL7|nr:hypothetical protein M7I_3085 [Glarea lozoyensis 74030]
MPDGPKITLEMLDIRGVKSYDRGIQAERVQPHDSEGYRHRARLIPAFCQHWPNYSTTVRLTK